jgi:hypothetical protein
MGWLADRLASLTSGAASTLALLLSHASRHNGGADPISIATDVSDGLMSAVFIYE